MKDWLIRRNRKGTFPPIFTLNSSEAWMPSCNNGHWKWVRSVSQSESVLWCVQGSSMTSWWWPNTSTPLTESTKPWREYRIIPQVKPAVQKHKGKMWGGWKWLQNNALQPWQHHVIIYLFCKGPQQRRNKHGSKLAPLSYCNVHSYGVSLNCWFIIAVTSTTKPIWRKEMRLLPLSIALGGFFLLLRLLSAGIREIFTHSKRYTAGHQCLMLLKKHHPEKMAKRHAKNVSKMERGNKPASLQVI